MASTAIGIIIAIDERSRGLLIGVSGRFLRRLRLLIPEARRISSPPPRLITDQKPIYLQAVVVNRAVWSIRLREVLEGRLRIKEITFHRARTRH